MEINSKSQSQIPDFQNEAESLYQAPSAPLSKPPIPNPIPESQKQFYAIQDVKEVIQKNPLFNPSQKNDLRM